MSSFGDARLPDRFWSKVRVGLGGCWEWQAALAAGYGRYAHGGKMQGAHRVAYSVLRGVALPSGPELQLDHLCRVRNCVNPDHLELVTSRENTLRGLGITAECARKTHCDSGHPFTDDNTYTGAGFRRCQECHRLREAERRARRPRRNERYARYFAAGLCGYCGDARKVGSNFCAACFEKRSRYERQRYLDRKSRSGDHVTEGEQSPQRKHQECAVCPEDDIDMLSTRCPNCGSDHLVTVRP